MVGRSLALLFDLRSKSRFPGSETRFFDAHLLRCLVQTTFYGTLGLLLGMYLTMATVDTSDIGSFGIKPVVLQIGKREML